MLKNMLKNLKGGYNKPMRALLFVALMISYGEFVMAEVIDPTSLPETKNEKIMNSALRELHDELDMTYAELDRERRKGNTVNVEMLEREIVFIQNDMERLKQELNPSTTGMALVTSSSPVIQQVIVG